MAAVLYTPVAHAGVIYDTRVLSGDAAPGTDVVYSGLRAPVLNNAGQVAFYGILAGTGVDDTNNISIWLEDSGSLSLIARSGGAAPGTAAGVAYTPRFGRVILNETGQVAFKGQLTGSGVNASNQYGIWTGRSGSLSLVARRGDAAPGTDPGMTYGDFNSLVTFNNAGQIAFSAKLFGGTASAGIWSGRSGSLRLVARTGDAAPGTASGVIYASFLYPVLNNAGQTTFSAKLMGPDIAYRENDSGIWSEGSGSLRLVARVGDIAPGAEGLVYGQIDPPRINSAGQIVFWAGTADPNLLDIYSGRPIWTGHGIWSDSSGSLRPIVREGDAAPGTALGVVYAGIESPFWNDAGQTAFWGILAGPGVDTTNRYGVWSGSSGSLRLVARSGDAAPGTALGVVYAYVDPFFNGAGQVAIFGILTGTGVSDTNDRGVWATDLDGQLTLIVREGDLFDVNDDPLIDEFRTIQSINLRKFSSGEDGHTSSFNDLGQLAFALIFTDGSSGIFVATVPEPVSVVLLGLGGLTLLARRRR